ncbi:hypothetical protein J5681_07095 [bacterium]|nr:hypothetical protein [bacterium]
MKKVFLFLILLLFAFLLAAEEYGDDSIIITHNPEYLDPPAPAEDKPEAKVQDEPRTETPVQNENQVNESVKNENPADKTQNETENHEVPYFTQFKFGLGADFDGLAGRPLIEEARFAMLRNQLGISLGFDFGWMVFQKTSGKGAGDLCLGFGFDLQYWVPTTHMSTDNHVDSTDFDDMNYIYSHYMRVPITLNISYEFKVNAGAIRRVGPMFSLGMNNNIFYFSYSTDQEGEEEYWDYRFDEMISHWKVSGTWELGIGMVFENNWILNASIGGDFGSQNIRSYLLYGKNGNKYDLILYDHHEFLMLETGYRF